MSSSAPAEKELVASDLVALFARRVEATPGKTAIRYRQRGVWRTLRWDEWDRASREIAAGLCAHVGPGERVAIRAETSVAWLQVDLAIALCGAVSVPLFPTVSDQDASHVLADSDCVALLVDDPERARGFSSARLVVDLAGARVGTSLDELRAAGRSALARGEDPLADRVAGLSGGSDLTWVYTSGTTGVPKGVILTHENAVAEAWALASAIPFNDSDEHLMVLPLAHIFGRHMLWGAILTGAVTSLSQPAALERDLIEVAPTFVGGVPRLFERIHERIMAEMTRRPAIERATWDYSIAVGREVSQLRQRGRPLPSGLSVRLALADRLALARVRRAFGDRLRFLISGSAPLDAEIAEFFHALGILVLEGYGLTETSGAITVNRPERYRFGTVGPAIPGAELAIASDGEILVRGRTVMRGYHGGSGAAAIDADGWLHTGDLGVIDSGFLKITGRKKHLIITSTGKNVAPSRIEGRLRARPGIAEAVVSGDRRPYLVALISLDEPRLTELSRREGLGCESYADLARHPRIRRLVQEHIDAVNQELAPYERIKRFAVPHSPLTETAGELTPSQKIRRSAVLGRYRSLLDELYEQT